MKTISILFLILILAACRDSSVNPNNGYDVKQLPNGNKELEIQNSTGKLTKIVDVKGGLIEQSIDYFDVDSTDVTIKYHANGKFKMLIESVLDTIRMVKFNSLGELTSRIKRVGEIEYSNLEYEYGKLISQNRRIIQKDFDIDRKQIIFEYCGPIDEDNYSLEINTSLVEEFSHENLVYRFSTKNQFDKYDTLKLTQNEFDLISNNEVRVVYHSRLIDSDKNSRLFAVDFPLTQ